MLCFASLSLPRTVCIDACILLSELILSLRILYKGLGYSHPSLVSRRPSVTSAFLPSRPIRFEPTISLPPLSLVPLPLSITLPPIIFAFVARRLLSVTPLWLALALALAFSLPPLALAMLPLRRRRSGTRARTGCSSRRVTPEALHSPAVATASGSRGEIDVAPLSGGLLGVLLLCEGLLQAGQSTGICLCVGRARESGVVPAQREVEGARRALSTLLVLLLLLLPHLHPSTLNKRIPARPLVDPNKCH